MSLENKSTQQERMGRIGERPYWVLNLSIVIRALHQVGAAVFLTTFLLKDDFVLPRLYLYLVFVSGFALIFTEWMRHREVFREISGIATCIKLILLGAAFHQFLPTTPTVVFTFLLASICSHAPKKVRHKLMY
ncbi:hypothetical protein [Desulforhopalus sp. 52FAK]